MHYKGIIIYKSPYYGKTTILDSDNIVDHVFIQSKKLLSIGSFIEYTKKQKCNNYFSECISIQDLPLLIAKEDIYFLHHVFEIIYSFVPVGKTIHGLFDHIFFLYNESIDLYMQKSVCKKLFIGRLLFLLSIYNEEQKPIITYLHKIKHVPIDRMIIESLDLAEEENLTNWLITIFSMHQKLNKFKTTYFTSHCGKI